jgi:hypothetical protein
MTHTIEEMAASACESTKSNNVTNVELNQAIGWIEYIHIKKVCSGKNINTEIDKRTQGEIALATKIAYIEDALSTYKADYDATSVMVTHKTSGAFLSRTATKRESLSDFIEINLKHAASDMYYHNVDEGMQYLSHCMHAIDQYNPVTKTGIIIDMHALHH